MLNFPKISLGSSAKKRYTRKMDFDNNTTMDFGFVQPLLSQRMEANGDIRVSSKQLVRLAPMPVPSFARVAMHSDASFVPTSEVVPYYEAMLSGQSYSVGSTTYKPTSLPTTTNAFLCYLVLLSSKCTIYAFSQGESTQFSRYNYSSSDSSQNVAPEKLVNLVLAKMSGLSITIGSSISDSLKFGTTNNSDFEDNSDVTPESADYIVFTSGAGSQSFKLAFCFEFSLEARHLRSILIGLGYGLNFNDRQPVSIVPLMSFYKAYYDLYAPQRTTNWLTTSCYKLIKYIEDNYYTTFYPVGSSGVGNPISNISQLFYLQDLCVSLRNCYYTSPDDYLSIHRATPNLSANSVSSINYDGSSFSLRALDSKLPYYSDPYTSLTKLQILQRLTRYVNKDSIIGKKMSEWLKVHFGADVANSLFKQSYHLMHSRLDLQINDVFNTADTAGIAGNGTGEHLGAYGGKGIGFGDMSFKFHAPVQGYVFVLSTIVPKASVFQGNSPDLYCINNDTIPNPDYDAVGFEATPLGVFRDDNCLSLNLTGEPVTNKTFGFVPRYSGLKIKKNIVNGDMSRRGTFDSMSPYYLDRILTSNLLTSTPKDASKGFYNVKYRIHDLPTASEQWRYPCRYSWLGNFDRLFINSGDALQHFDAASNISDNFIVQSIFNVSVTDFLKPLSQSFDTYEESSDTSTVDLSAE